MHSTKLQTTIKEPRKRSRTREFAPSIRMVYSGDKVCHESPIELHAGTKLLGRDVGKNDICIEDDPRLSRKHAAIMVSTSEHEVKLTDTSSTGTKINGINVEERHLHDGDVIRAGDSLFIFRSTFADSATSPTLEILGDAPAIRILRSTIELVGPTTSNVLLQGESGTGKELVARALHKRSDRSGAFIAVNCSAIPEQLAESQLFGHIAGAYTGATTASTGFFRAADKGTLFLDEIGDLSQTIQPKLLRAIEERAVTPTGSTKSIPCDFRLIAATHQKLLDAVAQERFRGDLYARLGEFVIELPPLRDRKEDILRLLQHGLGEDAPPIAPELAEELLLHDWPFNVRELLKVATRLKLKGKQSSLLDVDLLEGCLEETRRATSPSAMPPHSHSEPEPSSPCTVPSREELEVLLRKHQGVIADIARATGRSRKQVYRWLEKYALNPHSYRVS